MTDCPNCEYHKNRAARWRAEAYRQIGHEVELPWIGLTEGDIDEMFINTPHMGFNDVALKAIEAKLKEKNT